MNNRNYQRELEAIINLHVKNKEVPKLLLHSCCAPCSSYVLEYLSQYFEITINFYNPNIYPESEFFSRAREQQQLIDQMVPVYPIGLVIENYDSKQFYDKVKGHERDPEKGERCYICYEMRLKYAARKAAEGSYDYFTTTLSISPMKNAQWLNEIGERVGEIYGVRFLPSDFKKKEGYKRSIELSQQYNLYRQDYCGCIFSMNQKTDFNEERDRVVLDTKANL